MVRQVFIVGDSVGSLLGYDILCQSTSVPSDTDMGSTSGLAADDKLNEEKLLGTSHPNLVITPATVADTQNLCPPTPSRSRMSGSPRSSRTRHLSYQPESTEGEGRGVPELTSCGLRFEVCEMFTLGCPLGLVLAYRKLCTINGGM